MESFRVSKISQFETCLTHSREYEIYTPPPPPDSTYRKIPNKGPKGPYILQKVGLYYRSNCCIENVL